MKKLLGILVLGLLWSNVGFADENLRLICKEVNGNLTNEHIFNLKDGETSFQNYYYNDEAIIWIKNYNKDKEFEEVTHGVGRISRTTGKMTYNFYKLNDEQKLNLEPNMATTLQKYQQDRVERGLGLDKNLNTFAYAFYKTLQQFESILTISYDCEKAEKKF